MGRLIDEYEDIKTQQECVSKTFDTLWKIEQKYQQLQADYEARLKADMVAMLKDLQLEIEKLDLKDSIPDYTSGAEDTRDYIANMIEETIDKLKRDKM